MYLVINKWVTAVKVSNFTGHYLRNRSTLDIGALGYIGIVQHKEHSPKVLSIPPGTPCIRVCGSKGTLNCELPVRNINHFCVSHIYFPLTALFTKVLHIILRYATVRCDPILGFFTRTVGGWVVVWITSTHLSTENSSDHFIGAHVLAAVFIAFVSWCLVGVPLSFSSFS